LVLAVQQLHSDLEVLSVLLHQLAQGIPEVQLLLSLLDYQQDLEVLVNQEIL
jgi:hypothetical protein